MLVSYTLNSVFGLVYIVWTTFYLTSSTIVINLFFNKSYNKSANTSIGKVASVTG